MTKAGRELLAQLTVATGPFVTMMLNTPADHQGVEKAQLKLKNFAREAKRRFLKKYPDRQWDGYQAKIDALLADQLFWRNDAASVAIFLTEDQTLVHYLSIHTDDQYYVGDTPYLLAAIRNSQFNYTYYLLALNRNSMKLYFVDNEQISAVDLPADAPIDVPTALGEEKRSGDISYTSQGRRNGTKEGVTYHGVNTKDEEVTIDWKNYYQAVGTFLREDLNNDAGYPLYLFALPENQAMFEKYAKVDFFSTDAAIDISPSTLTDSEIGSRVIPEIAQQLSEKEAAAYQNALDRKFIDQLGDIVPASEEGKVANLFIATSNLVDGYGEDPDAEYDRRQILNTMAINALQNKGEAHILEQKFVPGSRSLLAILRY
ncbi:baeRF6 domain-containing protein [Lapidilactobacillus bayanensis]|uniref:baeRF6 domain-containing protein n=1 Tax=Lapidilactobacillus bayanensis TaxID=2485998 RepID=UPI000F776F76|nr:hypothetical protein [Lapidilactobacillus bayanensis]